MLLLYRRRRYVLYGLSRRSSGRLIFSIQAAGEYKYGYGYGYDFCICGVFAIIAAIVIARLLENNKATVISAIVGVALIALGFCVTENGPGRGTGGITDSYGHDWAVAMTVAEKAVKSKLKSPSSAEFSPKDETTINVSGNTWTVRGWVEAQNSFGATIRNSYSVKFTFNSSDKYTIEYCNIS